MRAARPGGGGPYVREGGGAVCPGEVRPGCGRGSAWVRAGWEPGAGGVRDPDSRGGFTERVRGADDHRPEQECLPGLRNCKHFSLKMSRRSRQGHFVYFLPVDTNCPRRFTVPRNPPHPCPPPFPMPRSPARTGNARVPLAPPRLAPGLAVHGRVSHAVSAAHGRRPARRHPRAVRRPGRNPRQRAAAVLGGRGSRPGVPDRAVRTTAHRAGGPAARAGRVRDGGVRRHGHGYGAGRAGGRTRDGYGDHRRGDRDRRTA